MMILRGWRSRSASGASKTTREHVQPAIPSHMPVRIMRNCQPLLDVGLGIGGAKPRCLTFLIGDILVRIVPWTG